MRPSGRGREADRSFRPLILREAALAVSRLDEPRRPSEHRGYYVRGDGMPSDAPSLIQRPAAVIAGDAMSADALTKCVLLCPQEPARRALASLGGWDLSEWGRRSALETGEEL